MVMDGNGEVTCVGCHMYHGKIHFFFLCLFSCDVRVLQKETRFQYLIDINKSDSPSIDRIRANTSQASIRTPQDDAL